MVPIFLPSSDLRKIVGHSQSTIRRGILGHGHEGLSVLPTPDWMVDTLSCVAGLVGKISKRTFCNIVHGSCVERPIMLAALSLEVKILSVWIHHAVRAWTTIWLGIPSFGRLSMHVAPLYEQIAFVPGVSRVAICLASVTRTTGCRCMLPHSQNRTTFTTCNSWLLEENREKTERLTGNGAVWLCGARHRRVPVYDWWSVLL